jgi:hypothetical protein
MSEAKATAKKPAPKAEVKAETKETKETKAEPKKHYCRYIPRDGKRCPDEAARGCEWKNAPPWFERARCKKHAGKPGHALCHQCKEVYYLITATQDPTSGVCVACRRKKAEKEMTPEQTQKIAEIRELFTWLATELERLNGGPLQQPTEAEMAEWPGILSAAEAKAGVVADE